MSLRIHRSFAFTLLVTALTLSPASYAEIARGAAAILLVVVVRELGHAAVLAALGIRARSLVDWQGGHTLALVSPGSRRLTRGQRLLALAGGPAAVLLLAGICEILNWPTLFGLSLGWGLLSLLPILPLPGGRMVETLLSRPTAIALSVVAAAASAFCLLQLPAPPLPVLVVAVALVENLAALVQSRRKRAELHRLRAQSHLGQGELDGAALALQLAFTEEPSDEAAAHLAAVLLKLGELDEALALWDDPSAGPALYHTLMTALFFSGRFPEAAQLGERSWTLQPRALTAYNLACTYCRLEQADLALSWLSRALDAGWRDLASFDQDEDLAPLRTRPEWEPLRARLTSLGRTG